MKMKRFISFFVVAGLLASPSFFNIFGRASQARAGEKNKAASVKAGFEQSQILVKFKTAAKPVRVFLAPEENPEKAAAEYEKNPAVEYAELNYTYKSAIIPSDSYYGEQWYLKKIKAQEAWDIKRESPSVTIAIIDSGVDIRHPDLKQNIWVNADEAPGNGIDDDRNGYVDDINGWDFINSAADPSPKFKPGFTEDGINHGTIVAGVAAAEGNNAAGISGVTWRAKIMPLKVLGDSGEGNTLNVVKAIDYAIAKGANIINFSFVGFGYSQALNEAVGRAHNAGIIIVAAAGNESEDGDGYFLDATPMYPVCHDGPAGENWVVGVASVDSLDQKSKFSSYGFKCIDIAAPGESIFSTVAYNPAASVNGKFFNSYYEGYWSGTSVATPQVAGALALILQADFSLSAEEAIKILLDNSDNISRMNQNYLGELGRGRLNVLNPLDLLTSRVKTYSGAILSAPMAGQPALLKNFGTDGLKTGEFFAYAENFLGGATMASGDLDGDGKDEIITGPGPGGGPHVRVFDQAGKLKSQFFAYAENFRGGVNVAAGDIDADGKDEIITGPGPGGGPHVRVFDITGRLKAQFFAYDKAFRGGVNVAAGNVDGDLADEIITGAGPGGGPQVRVFNEYGQAKRQFFAYDQAFRGGVNVAAGQVYEKQRGNYFQIITAPGNGLAAQVKVFSNAGITLSAFYAYTTNFKGGAVIAAGDLNNDGVDEIITGAGPGGAPHVRSFYPGGGLISSFFALDAGFNKGVNIGFFKKN